MTVNLDETNHDAQIVTFSQKAIRNTALNYYVKKSKLKEKDNDIKARLANSLFGSYLSEIKNEKFKVRLVDINLYFDDPVVARVLRNLSANEQVILFNKYLLGLTDREIAKELLMSRQNLTKKRHRLLAKIKSQLEK